MAQLSTAKAIKIVLPSARIAASNIPKREVVTAYARVSTNRFEQSESLDRQQSYYKDYIQRHNEWQYREIYSDPGLSGTKADKRPGFMQLIHDCQAGLINRVLCKSVSRFARNTIDALTYIRMLKDLKVSIFFETENIDTMTPGGEMLLTILAGMAEQESRSISKNVTWALNRKFLADGILMPTKNFLGYKRDDKNNIVIDYKEAPIVQRIFREFIGGYSTVQIANRLMEDGIKSPSGKDIWRETTVRSIIRNPKYCGDAIMGKTYKPDVLGKRVKNDGKERDMFYIPDCCPAIISKETFKLAQAEDNSRSNLRNSTKSGIGKYSNKHHFSGMLTCASCGSKLRRWVSGYREGVVKEYVWICVQKQTFKTCKEKPVKEKDIETAFVGVLNELIEDGTGFIEELRANIKAEVNNDLIDEIAKIDKQLSRLQADMLKLSRENRQGIISNSEYDKLVDENAKKQEKLINEKNEKTLKSEGIRLTEFRISEIERILAETEKGEVFDPIIFKELIDTAKLTRKKITFKFKCGLEIEKELEQSYRDYSERR